MRVVECDESHSAAILAIFNDAILNSTALYEYKPRTSENMVAWFETKRRGNFPILGAVNERGDLMGFASYGTFRPWAAFKYSVEHSLYVAEPFRRQGVGAILLQAIIAQAMAQDYHVLVGGIDSTNVASIALHTRFGFEFSGTICQAGFKFGRWLDLSFYQLTLNTPSLPVDG